MLRKLDKLIYFLRWPAFFILFSYLIFFSFVNLYGKDYFFHTRSGQYIVENKQIPARDIFSFTQEGKKWNNHEWLYQVFIYSIHQRFGFEGIILLRSFIFILAFLLLTIVALKVHWLFAFFLIFFSIKISFIRFIPRPDQFSFLFLIFFLLPLVFKKKNLLYLLPFIQVLWANIHGFFIMGPAVLFIYLCVMRFDKGQVMNLFYKKAKVVFIFVILACFLTPYPLQNLAYPFQIIRDIFVGHQDFIYQHITELRRPIAEFSLDSLYIRYFIATSIFLIFTTKTSIFCLVFWVFFSLFSFNAIRNFYFYIPIAVILTVVNYPQMKKVFLKRILTKKGIIFLKIVLLVGVARVSVFAINEVLSFSGRRYSYLDFSSDEMLQTGQIFFEIDKRYYPQELIQFIVSNELPNKMYNNFNLGAILIYNFFPQRKVFIDGRAEFYGKEFFTFYKGISAGSETELDKAIEEYNLNGFIIGYLENIPPDLIFVLHERGYRCIYFGMDGIIFIDDQVLFEYPHLSEKIINLDKYQPVRLDFRREIKLYKPHADGLYKKGYILYKIGLVQKAEEYLRSLLSIYPAHYRAYYLLAEISYYNKNYEKAYILSRKSLSFSPNFTKARKLIARIHLDDGDKSKAKEIIEALGEDFESFQRQEGF